MSFSARRVFGVSAAKGRLSRQIGIPLTRSGRQRKIGRAAGCCVPLAMMIAAVGVLSSVAAFASNPASKPASPPLKLKADAPDAARRAFEASEKLRKEVAREGAKLITLATEKLREVESARVERGSSSSVVTHGSRHTYKFGTPEEKAEAIAKRKADLQKAKAGVAMARAGTLLLNDKLTAEEMSVGGVGEIFDMKVAQVINENSFLASVSAFSDKAGSGGRIERVDVIVRGMSTRKLVDGVEAKVDGQAFRIGGTERYVTVVGGSRTVLSMEPFDLEKWVDR